MQSSEMIGIGVIGAGAMGRAYCECLSRHTTGARLVAIGGGRRAPELAAMYGVEPAHDVDGLLARPDLSAVIIATPEKMHVDQAGRAAQRGKHILVEKPMAPGVAACDEMTAVAARAGVTLMVVKSWRFRGVHRRARDLLAGGAFGAVRRIENRTRVALASSLATVAQKPFYLDPAGGGLLMGWAVHNLDWVRALASAEPRSVTARSFPGAAEIGPGRLEAEFVFANGVTARVDVAIDLPVPPAPGETFRTLIEAERGRLDLDGYGALRIARGSGWETFWTQPAFDPRNATDPIRLEAYAAIVQAFIDTVHSKATPPITGWDGRMAVAMFAAAREAAARNEAVTF